MLEGIDRVAAHVTARWGWRPDPRTAAVLIGGYGVYQFALSVPHIGDLITEASGTCAAIGPKFTGYACVVPSYERVVAIADLFVPVAFLVMVAGAVLIFARSSRGGAVMIGGLVLFASIHIVVVVASMNDTIPPQSLLSSWPGLVGALVALLAAGFVLLLPQPGRVVHQEVDSRGRPS